MLTSWEKHNITFFNAITQSKLKFSEKIKLLCHSGHLEETKVVFKQYFPMSYLSDVDDLDMTCSDFVNPLKMF